jgi:hypothetical protein
MGTDEKPAQPAGENTGTIIKSQPKKNGTAETWLWMWEISGKPIPTVEMNLPRFSNSQGVIFVYNFLKKFKIFLIFTLLFDILAIYAMSTPYTYLYYIVINRIPTPQYTDPWLGRFFLWMVGAVWLCSRFGLYTSRQPKNKQDVIFRLYTIFLFVYVFCFTVPFVKYVTSLEKI